MAEAGDCWLKPFFDLFLAGGGNPRERAAMKGIERGDDFEPASSWPNLRASLNRPSLASAPLLAKKHLPGPIKSTNARASRPCGP